VNDPTMQQMPVQPDPLPTDFPERERLLQAGLHTLTAVRVVFGFDDATVAKIKEALAKTQQGEIGGASSFSPFH
jgi:hypothetical protein